jgi:hypothetical protein
VKNHFDCQIFFQKIKISQFVFLSQLKIKSNQIKARMKCFYSLRIDAYLISVAIWFECCAIKIVTSREYHRKINHLTNKSKKVKNNPSDTLLIQADDNITYPALYTMRDTISFVIHEKAFQSLDEFRVFSIGTWNWTW